MFSRFILAIIAVPLACAGVIDSFHGVGRMAKGGGRRPRWSGLLQVPQNLKPYSHQVQPASNPDSAPTITLVANAFGDTPVIAPNTWVEIKGSNLAGGPRTWLDSDFANSQMPTQLDGVSATVNGKQAYLYYISPTQINILTPPDSMPGSVQVQVASGGVKSAPFTVQTQPVAPSFFVLNGGPYVFGRHPDGSLIGPTNLFPGFSTPVKPGETVTLAANGFGPTSSPVVSGSEVQSGTLPTLPVIEIGGIGAAVQFAGLVSPGLFLFNAVVPDSAAEGDNNLTATYDGATTQSGVLITVSSEAIKTTQSGNMLFLQSSLGGTTTRIGLNTTWGGSIVEASLNGVNYVNHSDSGREVQPALYDGTQKYDPCAGCTGNWGWNPVQAGDRYSHGSPILAQIVTADSIYIKTQPLEWYPDNKGGGPTKSVLTDTYFEQTITTVPGYPQGFRAHYKLTHFGADTHPVAQQEFPAIYVNQSLGAIVYYSGTSPWTNDAVTKAAPIPTCSGPQCFAAGPPVYSPEYWSAFVDANDMGLTVFVPAAYPEWSPSLAFEASGSTGEMGTATNYSHPIATFPTIGPNWIIEGDIFLLLGDYKNARQTIYALHRQLTVPDIMPAFGSLDTPAQNARLSGTVNTAGWAIDNVAVAKVEISVDSIVVGQAEYGLARAEVAAIYPWVSNPGDAFSLDTTSLADGPHQIAVIVTDSSNNVSILGPVAVVVDNSSLLSLSVSAGGQTARIIADPAQGGSIVKVSLNGTNYLRRLSISLYDSSQLNMGWNPVLGGDRYGHSSPVLAQTVTPNSVYVKTQPLESYPDNKGGGPMTPVVSDMYFEQTITAVAPAAQPAFRIHYKLTHIGTDTHYNSVQEVPGAYADASYSRFVYYSGTSPWSQGTVTKASLPSPPGPNALYSSEYWAAFLDGNDMGLAVFNPGLYPYLGGFSVPSSTAGAGYNYFRPFAALTIGPGSVIEGDYYLAPGDYTASRALIYALNQQLGPTDASAPYGFIDTPRPNATVSGTVTVGGWAFDNVAVSKVEVFVDGAIAGQAIYGNPRSDIPSVYPNASANTGYSFALDTTKLSSGKHTIVVRVSDSSNNVALFTPVPVIVSN